MPPKRLKIGILATFFDPHWTGGFIYLVNLINALQWLDEADRPEIVVFYNERSENKLGLIEYPYIQYVFLANYKSNFTTYLQSWLRLKNLFVKDIIVQHQLDGLYPVNDFPGRLNNPQHHCRVVSWYPDYQQKFYPEYFTRLNLFFRELRIQNILKYSTDLVQSSHDVYGHLQRFFRYDAQRIKIHVLPFVSLIEGIPNDDIAFLRQHYDVTLPYFIVSNQFYKHKNHIVVYEAMRLLKQEYPDFQVVFTGKEEDYRNPAYIASLRRLVDTHQLTRQVRSLGVIPRAHQLGLMKHALAVIQPSKFEGWSTVVEDAKSLQKQILLSRIPVHVEQMGDRAYYFEADEADELKTLMHGFLTQRLDSKPVFENYQERIKIFADSFIAIFKQ